MSARMFPVAVPTPSERAALRHANEAAQPALFDVAPTAALTDLPCPVCGGMACARHSGREASLLPFQPERPALTCDCGEGHVRPYRNDRLPCDDPCPRGLHPQVLCFCTPTPPCPS